MPFIFLIKPRLKHIRASHPKSERRSYHPFTVAAMARFCLAARDRRYKEYQRRQLTGICMMGCGAIRYTQGSSVTQIQAWTNGGAEVYFDMEKGQRPYENGPSGAVLPHEDFAGPMQGILSEDVNGCATFLVPDTDSPTNPGLATRWTATPVLAKDFNSILRYYAKLVLSVSAAEAENFGAVSLKHFIPSVAAGRRVDLATICDLTRHAGGATRLPGVLPQVLERWRQDERDPGLIMAAT